MNYNDVIRNKNRILAITLLICIVMRCIVNEIGRASCRERV